MTGQSKFADDTTLRGAADTPEGHAAIQRDLDRLEKGAMRILMKSNKEKCKVLYLGRNNPRHQYMLGSRLAEKELEVLVGTKYNSSQQTVLAAKAYGVLGCIRQSVASRLREVRPYLEHCVQFWTPQHKRDMDILERVQKRATSTIKGLEHFSF